MFPNLSLKLKPRVIVSDKNYFYRLTKKGKWVLRMAKIDVIEKPFGNEQFEKCRHSPYGEDKTFRKKLVGEHPNQIKLLEDLE